MDVEALRLLHAQWDALNRLPNPDDADMISDKYEAVVTKTMAETKKTIKQVSTYAEKIGDELQTIRELISKCSIKIGEQIKKLMKNNLLKGDIVFKPGSPITGKDIDKNKVQQVLMMQRLTKQKQELMEFIAKTEELVKKIETNADLSYSDIMVVKGLMNQWCEEEKKKMIREEKEEKERKKSEKKEAEKRRKETEEREKREKEEAEKRRKEKEEREKNEKKEAERQRKEEEEREKREKEEAERQRKKEEERKKREKEEKERKKREKEEAEKRRKEEEEREKREKEEAERRRKEEEEKGKREKEEAEKRLKEEEEERKKRENEEAERRRKETEERKKKEKKEAERQRKEEEEREKEEAERQRKKEEERKKREKEEKERKKREKEEAEKRRKEEEEREKREKEEAERRRKEEEEREKKEKEEAERRRKEEEEEEERKKREKEETERRRKETEEREAEEKRRKQEQEKKRLDWKNWPPFIYNNPRRTKFQQDICCVIFVMPDGIHESDLVCQSSDAEVDLDICLESNDEQIISSLITIKPKNDKRIKFKIPIRVYVPVVSHDQTLDPKLKFLIKGKEKWWTGKSLPKVQLPGVFNITFVGVEIAVENFKGVQCVAVARHKCDETEVDVDGKIFEPEVDRNIKVKFPPKSFPGKTTVAAKAVSWTHKDIKNASKKYKELQNIKTAGSYFDITCENLTKKDTNIEMYDFGWVVDKDIPRNQTVNQETLNRCSRWVVNNMNPNDLQVEDVFDSDFVEELKSKETQGDKNRHVLRRLHNIDDSDFDSFLDHLKTTQPKVSERINNVKAQVHVGRTSSATTSEDDFGNDFDPDFEKKKGTVCIVSKLTGKSWEVVPIEASDEHPKARFLKLPSGNNKFQVLGLVVPEGMPDEDICRAAEILEGLNCVTNISVICRQKHANPHDVIIECVKSENVAETLQHLDKLGYNDGPPESAEFGVVDGEEIEIKFEHNLCLEGYKYSSLKIKFYKHLPFDRYSRNLKIVNKGDQGEEEKYHGYLTYNVPPGRLSVPRQGKLVLYVPKPLEEIIGNFPYTLDVPVKALAKFIAWQLTKDNFNSTRWVRHAGYLTDLDKHLYHQIVKHVDEERKGAPQRERCEAFILYWANNHAPFDYDKIQKILTAHHDQKLESEAELFIKPYTPGKGLLSNDNLEKMAYAIAADWEPMAKKLGFSNDEINQIRNGQPGMVRQTLRMLDIWRLSTAAIQKGSNLIKNLHDTARSVQCGAKLLGMISNHV